MQTNREYITSHAEPSTYSRAVLNGLGADQHHLISAKRSRTGGRPFLALQQKHVYGGTVPYEVVQKRRAKNRVARKSRRVNRLRAK